VAEGQEHAKHVINIDVMSGHDSRAKDLSYSLNILHGFFNYQLMIYKNVQLRHLNWYGLRAVSILFSRL